MLFYSHNVCMQHIISIHVYVPKEFFQKLKKVSDVPKNVVSWVPNVWTFGNFQMTDSDFVFWFCQSGLMWLPFKFGA